MKPMLALALTLLLHGIAVGAEPAAQQTVEQWRIFELVLQGPEEGNPYMDVKLRAEFRQGDHVVSPEGFYDGDGVYRIRFSPDRQGSWTCTTKSDCPELDGHTKTFVCTAPGEDNHGPVRVWQKTHFAYADGTPYFQIGTTCYAWIHQGDKLEEQTLATLATSPFNKIRMCIFPKHYTFNKNEPQLYVFPRKDEKNDYERFSPEFFHHLEKRIGQLRDLGIEADLILFHPYDRWGYANMDAASDDRYLRYVVARLAAYRNVWWSFANEFDLMKAKTMDDWDRFFQIVQKHDPHNRLRGIHNCREWYDHNKPWVTHASIQSSDFTVVRELPGRYEKPCVYDECKYEGNIPNGWGKITAEEMVHRFWLGTIAGCYVGHGETYLHPKDILWWSKGGVLHGESPARIAFLRRIMEPSPFSAMSARALPGNNHLLELPGVCYYIYFPEQTEAELTLPKSRFFQATGFDTWNMTEADFGRVEPGPFRFTPPAPRYLLRLSTAEGNVKLKPALRISADRTEGTVPLTVRVQPATDTAGDLEWDFGDGTVSRDAAPSHTYAKPGRYTVTLRTGKGDDIQVGMPLVVTASRPAGEPIVRFGFGSEDYPAVGLHGKITRADNGTFNLPQSDPNGWIAVGDVPMPDLERLESFTILGWACPSSLKTGAGGNRIAFNLNYNRAGFDLVQLDDGRLRLAVNEWPDRCKNDSSPGKLQTDQWTFFAVTYDSRVAEDNVRWYFGADKTPALLDRANTYVRGPTGSGSGPLTIGNYNTTIHRHGTDRQFRGALRGVEIFGSPIGSKGVLDVEAILQAQKRGARP